MWEKIAAFVLKNRLALLIFLIALTAFMGWQASQVKLDYEFAKAIPTDNPKYVTYQQFRKTFGDDGNLLVVSFQSDKLFTPALFNDFRSYNNELKKVPSVEDVLSLSGAVTLVKNDSTEKLVGVPVFPAGTLDQMQLDSASATFRSLPFYKGLLYNPSSNAWLVGVRINKQVLNSAKRTDVVNGIIAASEKFGQAHQLEMHYSGLPLIRTQVANRIAAEMKWLLLGSLALSAIILLLFFRSISTMVMSLLVVIMGVIFSVGTLHLLGYKITLLTALIPPLIVVIGIPNCIYFLNKYHISYNESQDKHGALLKMISRMGIVTLFCNIAAAIGFAVFALTRSAILKEFGEVAGINIMLLFVISFIFIPAVLSYLPAPKPRHTKYLNNRALLSILSRLEVWSLNHRGIIYGTTAVLCVVAIMGIMRLRSEGYIVDDLPKTDKIYTDLKYFEKEFKGVMPLEILVDTRRKNGLRANLMKTLNGVDSLSSFIAAQPEMARPLSIAEGLKFARQGFYDGDSANYGLPNDFDLPLMSGFLSAKPDSNAPKNNVSSLVNSFMDSAHQMTRISVNMKDVGSKRLPVLLDKIQQKSNQYFDSTKYRVVFTGSSVTFLEGSSFIIKGLKESILWAFGLIALCMLYLFRSFRILLCSLIPNLIPLVITAGVMGWVGIALKPSTVLIFSVALGIAIDITIRFLVNYKQEQTGNEENLQAVVVSTIHTTGISIIYTSLVLVAGFIIFCFSSFGGTQSLGWLTSLTLVVATFTNLLLLPALLLSLHANRKLKKIPNMVKE